MNHKIYISRDKRGLGSEYAHVMIKKAARAALGAEGIAISTVISVLLTDDEGMRRINLEFRGVDKPTDVLSFPQNEFAPGGFDPGIAEKDRETDAILLGDIAISLPRARAQGEAYGHGPEHEIMYLTVHGVLHLLGYDHLDEGEMKKQMREREKSVMSALEGER